MQAKFEHPSFSSFMATSCVVLQVVENMLNGESGKFADLG